LGLGFAEIDEAREVFEYAVLATSRSAQNVDAAGRVVHRHDQVKQGLSLKLGVPRASFSVRAGSREE
jgi:hypothetical protein